MTEHDEASLRAEIHKRATVLKERAQEIQGLSQYGVLGGADGALEAVTSKAQAIRDDAAELDGIISAWFWAQKAEKNG